MIHAYSIRHNSLVLAEDCDYDDYAKIILICPLCKQNVYLNRGRTSSTKYDDQGKVKRRGYKTAPYFCHFDSKGTECENRSQGMNKQALRASVKKSQAEAKRQRLKIIEERLEIIFSLAPINHHVSTACAMAHNAFNPKKDSKFEVFYRQELVYFRKVAKPWIRGLITQLSEDYFKRPASAESDNIWHQDRFEYLQYLKDPFELSQHLKIVYEVMDFLLAPPNHKLFFRFFISFAFQARLTHAYIKLLEHREIDDQYLQEARTSIPLTCALRGISGLFDLPLMEQVINYDSHPTDSMSIRAINVSIAQYFTSALMLTPWAIGFEIAQTKTAPPDFAIWKRQAATRMLIKDDLKQWLLINVANSLYRQGEIDFAQWLSQELFSQAPFLKDPKKAEEARRIETAKCGDRQALPLQGREPVTETLIRLPRPFDNLTIALECRDYLTVHKPIRLILSDTASGNPWAEAQIWTSNSSIQFQRWAKKKFDHQTCKKLASPWADSWMTYVIRYPSSQDQHINLIQMLVNAYLYCLRYYLQQTMIDALNYREH